jgi:hypothetical protein
MAQAYSNARFWLLLSLMVLSATLRAQTLPKPVRSIPLPAECQHPSRSLFRYGEGQRLGLTVKSGFCRIDVANGEVKEFRGLGEIKSAAPAPRSLRVAIVNGFDRITVLNDLGRSEFDGHLDSTGWAAVYWSRDESHLVVLSFSDDSDEADTITIIDLARKTMKSIDVHPPAPAQFDAKSETVRVEAGSGAVRKVAVYNLRGELLRHEGPQKSQKQRVDSPSHIYYYTAKQEVGEGDTLIRKSSSGDVIVKLPEFKSVNGQNSALWDNPEWNPVSDDLLLELYLPAGLGNEGGLSEFEIFSISRAKVIKAFPLEENVMPAYGWSADGKDVVLCDLACSFYSIP